MKPSMMCVAALTTALFSGAPAAYAENRLALVIGQSAYRTVPPLPNPANDAKMMTEMLSAAGFDVTAMPDVSQSEMRKAIGEFAEKLNANGSDTVALVFYAGHGLQVDGENFLLPVDVRVQNEADIPLQGVRLDDLLNALASAPSKTRIVMLDSCRDNPFPGLEKTLGKGLAIVDTKAGSAGSFISFSTSPGAVAEDGTGTDSPYTTALLTAARQPGLSIEQALKRVRVAVNQVTDGRQTPWESSSLTTDFYFFPGPGDGRDRATKGERTKKGWRRELRALEPQAAYERVIGEDSLPAYEAFVELFSAPPLGPRVRALLDRRREMMAWAAAVAINTPASYEAFLANYPSSDLAATARKLMERMRNRLQAASSAAGPIAVALAQPTGPAAGGGLAGPAGPSGPTGLGAPTSTPVQTANQTPASPISIATAVPMCPCVVPPPVRVKVPTLKRSDQTPPPDETPRKHVDTTPSKHTDEPPPRHVEQPTRQVQRTTTASNRSNAGVNSAIGTAIMIGGLIAGGLALGHGHGGGGGGGGGAPMMGHPYKR
jgi:Caspase domain